MPSPRELLKERKQAQVREEILKVAARLIAERGYRGVKIDDIAAELGYTKSAVYYYFDNKADLLWRLFEEIYDTYIDTAQEIRDSVKEPREALRTAVRQHIEWVAERRDWTTIFFREEAELSPEQQKVIRSRKREYDRILESIYARGVEEGDFLDIPPALALNCILGACNWIQTWYRPGGRHEVAEIAESYATILAQGYLTDNVKDG